MSGPTGHKTCRRLTAPPPTLSERLSGLLSGISAKALARITGRSIQAAERWKGGDNTIGADALFALARELDDVWDLVREQCGRSDSVAEAEQTLAKMAELLAERKRNG